MKVAEQSAVAGMAAQQKTAGLLGHLQLRWGQGPAGRHVLGCIAQCDMRRRVGRDLVIVDGDSIDPHAGEFVSASSAGGGLRQLAEQRGQRRLGFAVLASIGTEVTAWIWPTRPGCCGCW